MDFHRKRPIISVFIARVLDISDLVDPLCAVQSMWVESSITSAGKRKPLLSTFYPLTSRKTCLLGLSSSFFSTMQLFVSDPGLA